jgi:hypothetical protein
MFFVKYKNYLHGIYGEPSFSGDHPASVGYVIILAQLHLFAFSPISVPAYSVGGPTLFLSSLQFLHLHSGPEKEYLGLGK